MFYRFTSGLVLRSHWRPYLPRVGERVLVFRGLGVFPPGHPTTRLCLSLLAEILSARGEASRLLDVGCGSGILMLAAAAWGVPLCVGVDLSFRAVKATQANARNNGLEGAVRLVKGSTECLEGPFPVILANLPWKVQWDKVEEFRRLAAPGTWLILSGFRDTQEQELWGRYQAGGWVRRQRLTREEAAIELPPEKSFTWVAWLLEYPGR